ncbi:hypothetical protein ACFYSC_26900 [Streptosporangium sp. NPDC004379]|uniref:hypothetical protein n=1 Tax=Streptosporangium sp. NPDC004379 TaxID=3366189 RepID=UPI00367A7BE0
MIPTSLMKTLLKCSKRERVSGGLLYRGTLSRKELGRLSRLVITAPPADEVIDESDLLEYVRERNEPIPEDSGNT